MPRDKRSVQHQLIRSAAHRSHAPERGPSRNAARSRRRLRQSCADSAAGLVVQGTAHGRPSQVGRRRHKRSNNGTTDPSVFRNESNTSKPPEVLILPHSPLLQSSTQTPTSRFPNPNTTCRCTATSSTAAHCPPA